MFLCLRRSFNPPPIRHSLTKERLFNRATLIMVYPLKSINELKDAIYMDKQTILVVDDMRSQTLVLKQILHSEWSVKTALNGLDALTLATEAPPPDLILLDVTMPDMDGYEVCLQLKSSAATRDIPVIFITALADQGSEAFGLQLGAVDYIIKPVNAPIVRARVRNHLALQRARAELAIKNEELERLAIQDKLTGLYNRRKLDKSLAQEITRAGRYGRPLSIIMLDLDHFKEVNDTHGHPTGDAVLVETAARLRKALRTSDILGRWGGEEFLILCPETGLQATAGLANRLLRDYTASEFPTAGRRTASFGVATHRAGDRPEELLSRADAALYCAKKKGRNRVELESS